MSDEPKFDFSRVLQRTPEEIRADEDEQAENEKRARQLPESPEKRQYLHALGTEKDARANIDAVIGGLEIQDSPKAENILTAALQFYRARLAESLFWQGNFAEAAELESRTQAKAEYELYASSMNRLDAPVCDCTNIQIASPSSAKGVSVPAKRIVQTVFVESLDKSVDFLKCEKCQCLFAVSK